MSNTELVVSESVPETQAPAVRQPLGAISTQRMTVEELRSNLAFIHEVMQTVMKEGQDYGKVPGCGDKPSLLQPGAQKLCMTFQLQDRVKKEEIIDLPNYHREYRFTISLVSATGREWDGVGTCSTLEAKYRYKTAGRVCPRCHKDTIRKSKKDSGWYCWSKLGGCGANFPGDSAEITSQKESKIEHDNPADFWNTVRKMAFKRALVHAAINATNTSELWTQDVEDNHEPEAAAPTVSTSSQTPPPAPAPAIKPKQTTGPKYSPPTAATRKWMVDQLDKLGLLNESGCREYFQKVEGHDLLMPNESIADLPLPYVPNCHEEMNMLVTRIKMFLNGERAFLAFEPHMDAEVKGKPAKPIGELLPKGPVKDPLWWREVIVPIPRKGQKRADYVGKEDTLGSLFDKRHGEDEESNACRQRLWGFVNHYEPKGWTKKDGTQMPASETDLKFREALDALAKWFEENHRGEKL